MNKTIKRRTGGYAWISIRKTLLTLIIGLLFVLAGSGCGRNPESEEATPKPSAAPQVNAKDADLQTIVSVGDSLTAGLGVDEEDAYPSLLEKKLRSDGYAYRVINAGISGETTSGTLARIDWIVSSLKPDMVILVIGANDGFRGIDPDLMRKNLDQIITFLKTKRIHVLLGGMKMLRNLGPDYVRVFENIYPEMARKHNIPLIPFFLEGVAGVTPLNQPDGIHPNAEGYRILVDHIYPYILKSLPPKKGGKK
jgi:acyl-CoA thioesterase-1